MVDVFSLLCRLCGVSTCTSWTIVNDAIAHLAFFAGFVVPINGLNQGCDLCNAAICFSSLQCEYGVVNL